MTLPPVTLPALRRQIDANLAKHEGVEVLAFRAGAPWEGPDEMEVDDRRCRLAWCPSELAIRERLGEERDPDALLVLLTPLPDQELGSDVRARLPKGRLIPLDPWSALLHLFGANSFDPRLAHHSWMPQALLESVPAAGFRPVPTGLLDRATAWSALLEHRLGIPEGRADIAPLLRWTLDERSLEAFRRQPEEVRRGVENHLLEVAGEAEAAVARLAAGERGLDAVPFGLACGVIFSAGCEEVPALREAAVRLEPILGERELSQKAGRAWAEEAARVVAELRERGDERAVTLLGRGDAVLEELKASSEAGRSPVLPSGYRSRLERFASVLVRALEEPPASLDPASDEFDRAATAVLDHRFPRSDQGGGVEMAGRLVRWLGRKARSEDEREALPAAARRYASDGAYVDWARTALSRADAGAVLAPVYARLQESVTARRESDNERFGRQLASWFSAAAEDPSLVPVEEVLERVVVPLASAAPILLIVLDGIGLAVFHEIEDGLRRRGWMEHVPAEPGSRLLTLAALPSITRVCRTSLLAGALREGDQASEKRAFEGHRGLRDASAGGKPPLLFHQAELRSETGNPLAGGAWESILDPRRRIVGAVVNAVDDHLLKGEQVVPSWAVEVIRPLPGLLEAATEAGRTVVVAADHGHVLDRGTESREGKGGERWRAAPPPPAEGEIELEGPRVMADDHRIVAPWSERIRYSSARRSGYHGGAAPQEVLAPLAVLSLKEESPEGWRRISGARPRWWEQEEEAPAEPTDPAARTAAKATRPKKPSMPQIGLFEEPEEVAPEPAAESPGWIDRLLASEMLAAQREQAGPVQLTDERLRRTLLLLSAQGGRMTREALGRALDLPPLRVQGLVAVLQRLLNVEGYPVLASDPGGETVSLDRSLLERQFEIDG